ncbi:unnamed protein product, partial [Laminaria digitata]
RTSCLGKGRTCISDTLSEKRLDELARFIGRCTTRKDVRGNQPRTDAGAVMWRPRKSPEKLVEEFCENNTTPEKVFGAPLGKMPPASRPTNLDNEEKFDYYGHSYSRRCCARSTWQCTWRAT